MMKLDNYGEKKKSLKTLFKRLKNIFWHICDKLVNVHNMLNAKKNIWHSCQ